MRVMRLTQVRIPASSSALIASHTVSRQHLAAAATEAERDVLRELVADLRAQRDREAEERRKLITLLVDRRPFWKKWFR
jgi:hypothetical protein